MLGKSLNQIDGKLDIWKTLNEFGYNRNIWTETIDNKH